MPRHMNLSFRPSPSFLLALALLTIYACDDPTPCHPHGGPLNVQYTHDGNNAIFGVNAIVERNDITFSVLDQPDKATDMWFVDSTMTLRIFMSPGHTYILTLAYIRSDTFEMTEYLQPRGRNCAVTFPISVTMNGEVVCDDGCESKVEVMF